MVKSKMSLTYKFLTAINSYFVVPHAGLKNLVLSCRLKSVSDVRIFHKLVGRAGERNRYFTASVPSSETQGQIAGTRESLNGRKNGARRKVKNGEKSPWGRCLTRPVPNGRRRSGF